jgi:hypothetical protein
MLLKYKMKVLKDDYRIRLISEVLFLRQLFPISWLLPTSSCFLLLLVSGLTIIFNAGNADKQKQASQTLTAAVLGFVLIFAAYWIMRFWELLPGLT